MKTDELQISNSAQVITEALDKIELIALYTGMTRRDSTSMRLLAEEMLSATKNILEAYDGKLWMETDGAEFTLHLSVAKPCGKSKREGLIALSKTGKATPPKGLFSRLSVALEEFLLMDDDATAPMVFTNYSMYTVEMYGVGSLYTYNYLPQTDNVKKTKATDELAGIEKSIIDAIVDDILVTLKEDSVEIIAVKKLNKA